MLSHLARAGRGLNDLGAAAVAHARLASGRTLRFSGAFPSREAALASLPTSDRAAYDQDDVADVAYSVMCQVAPWDYPVLYWLSRITTEAGRLSLLDAGGHLGTKYTAFAAHLQMEQFDWHVWDLPAILRQARNWQEAGKLPAEIRFDDSPADAGPVDVLLASGLMQYIDKPLGDLVADMAAPPKWIVLNKVAVRPGDAIVTLEKIGPAKVPYQIRSEAEWAAEMSSLDYAIADAWDIPGLGHRIPTHPWLGESRSRGYVLERVTGI